MKIGLALQGGGVRGAAHIGVIKTLEENNIRIDNIGGTSAGSMVSVLYSMGYKPKEMLELFKHFSKTIMGVSTNTIFGMKTGGIISSSNIELVFKEISKLRGIDKITDIEMPIVIPATDLIGSKQIVFTNSPNLKGDNYISDIEVAKAVRASSTFPGIYRPFEYKNFQFVDGGIFNNLPVKELKETGADKVIAIKFNIKENKKNNTMYNIIMQVVDIMSDNLIMEQEKYSECLIDIDLKGIKVFNINKIDFCYEEGYIQTMENMDKIKKCLKFNKIA